LTDCFRNGADLRPNVGWTT